MLDAAEQIASDILQPILRSRGKTIHAARELCQDSSFVGQMRSLFEGEPAGCLKVCNSQETVARITDLEQRLISLEADMNAIKRHLDIAERE